MSSADLEQTNGLALASLKTFFANLLMTLTWYQAVELAQLAIGGGLSGIGAAIRANKPSGGAFNAMAAVI
jgi:hypothetical protein